MKKTAAFLISVIIAAALGICAFAAFDVTTTTMPEGTAYKYYSASIPMSSGTDGYTFSLASGSVPAGLTLSEDGVLSGTPTVSGTYKRLRVNVTDDATNETTILKFTIRIAPREVVAVVSADETLTPNTAGTSAGCTYDGKTHGVSAEFYDYSTGTKGDKITVSSYRIFIGSTELTAATPGVTDAGQYGVTVYNPSGCTVVDVEGVTTVNIYEASAAIEVDDLTVKYGSDYSMTVTTDPENVGYVLQYRVSGAYTETRPTACGTYNVRAYICDGNYTTAYAYATLTIQAGTTLNFTVTDNEAAYDGNVHYVTVSASDGTETDYSSAYTVAYSDADGNAVDAPTDAGTYTIKIKVTDTNAYAVGTVSANTLMILPYEVTFSVSNNSVTYDGTNHTATVTPVTDGLTADAITALANAYSIAYRKSGEEETAAAVSASGIYDIVVTFGEDVTNFTHISSVTDNVIGTMTIAQYVETSLNIGNSPAAMIYKNVSEGNQSAALEYFNENYKFSEDYGYCPTTVTYTGLTDIDTDRYALIVTDIDSFTDPGMVVTIDGAESDTVYGSISANPDERGVYTLTYSLDDNTMTRNVIEVASKPGDINGNGVINALDANYLQKYLTSDKSVSDLTTGYATLSTVDELRIYDVNGDGVLNKDDISAIIGRYDSDNGIVSYYPWIF